MATRTASRRVFFETLNEGQQTSDRKTWRGIWMTFGSQGTQR